MKISIEETANLYEKCIQNSTKIKGLSDERKRKSIPLFNIVMPVLIFLMLQYESFHTIFQRRKAWRNDRKTVSVEKSQKLMQSGSSFPD